MEDNFTGLIHIFPGKRSDRYKNFYATFPSHAWVVTVNVNSATITGQAYTHCTRIVSFFSEVAHSNSTVITTVSFDIHFLCDHLLAVHF